MTSLRAFLRDRFRSRQYAAERPPAVRALDCMQFEDRTLFSATPMAAEVLVNTDTTGVQQTHVEAQQSVAADASGNFVVAWTSNGQDGSGAGVYAQRFDTTGNKVGGEIQVNSTTANDQLHASVAADSSGNFVVVWESLLQDGAGYGIFAQRFDASGNTVGGEFQVNTTTFSDQRSPSAAMDGAGNFVITWSSFGQDGSGYGVYGQRYDASGAAQGSEFQIGTATTGDQDYSSATFTGTGDFIVTWTGQDADATGIFAQRFNSSGVAQGSEFQVNATTTDAQIYSSVAADSAGNFVIAWASNLQDGGGFGIFAQRFNSAGIAQGSEFQVNVATTGDQSAPRVAMAANGAFVVSWTSSGQDAAGTDGVYFRQYDSAGVAQTNETLANSTTSGNQRFSSVAMQSNDSFVVVWSGSGSGDTQGVFAQLYVDGTNLAPVNTVPGAQSTAEDTGLVFSTGNGNQISVADADAQSNPLRVTLTATNGAITLASSTGITFSAGDGTDDLTMTFTGTAKDINAALNGLTFTPGTNFVGAAGVAITTNDLGYSGTGGAKSDTDNVAITISALNDVDADSGSLLVSLNVGGGTGTLSLASMTGLSFITGDGTADASMQFAGASASINAALDGLISSASSLSVPTVSGDSGVYEASDGTSAVADTSAAANEIAATVRHELVIVDANIEDVDRLIADVQANADASRRFEVVRVNFQGDGVKQISDLLAAYDDLSAIHLLSHASDGALRLGDVQLTNANFDNYSAEIARWRGSLTADADLLFYGCELAAGEQGRTLLTRFEQTTGADVAASTDNTGNALFGGNWNLEFTDGPIETIIAVSATAQRQWMNILNVAVNNTSSGSADGQASLTISHQSTGANRLMLVGISFDPHGDTITSVTYNGIALTRVGQEYDASTHASVEIWALVAPSSGIHDVVINTSGTSYNGLDAGVMTFTGVDQTTPLGSFAGAFGKSASAAVTVASQATDVVFGLVSSHSDTTLATPDPGQTEFWNLQIAKATSSGTLEAGAASVDSSWTVHNEDWAAGAISIRSSGTNTAPTLDATKTPVLGNVVEDAGAPVGAVGTLVSSLVDFDSPSGQVDNVVDPDGGALLGIAITNADTANGSWWYSTDNGSNWNALGAVSDGNARLLSADANTRIYFQPSANYNGTVSNAVTFRAWDQDTGTNGSTADTTTNGGTTAFSTATDTAAITVSTVNDAPVVNVPSPQTATEDDPLVFSSGNGNAISISDVDASTNPVQVTLTAINGLITLNGLSGLSFVTGDGTADATMTFTGTIANINTALNGLSFTPTTNYNGAASLQIVTNDQGNTGSGGALSDTDTIAITVNAVNDAPANTVPGAQTTAEDTTLVFSSGNGNQISITDIDAGSGLMQVTLNATNGAITLSG
ncbi:MAG: DUF4347 domain-containing protein, partial [Planctomycetia bacterium]|nr:DUF4347 domain-containing protein [Planctomycetia bacterium]